VLGVSTQPLYGDFSIESGYEVGGGGRIAWWRFSGVWGFANPFKGTPFASAARQVDAHRAEFGIS